MSRWSKLSPPAINGIELGSFLLIARPDGKSWSGILISKDANGFQLRNANSVMELHFRMNPTASYMQLPIPKWELGFGDRQLPFG